MAMNSKLVEAGLGMLARMIPPEEYAKMSGLLGELLATAKGYEERLKGMEAKLDDALSQLVNLTAAAQADSPTFNSMEHERALWQVPGSIEAALAPAPGPAPNGEAKE